MVKIFNKLLSAKCRLAREYRNVRTADTGDSTAVHKFFSMDLTRCSQERLEEGRKIGKSLPCGTDQREGTSASAGKAQNPTQILHPTEAIALS